MKKRNKKRRLKIGVKIFLIIFIIFCVSFGGYYGYINYNDNKITNEKNNNDDIVNMEEEIKLILYCSYDTNGYMDNMK